MFRRCLIVLFATALIAPLAAAQHRVGGFSSGRGFSRGARSFRRGYSAWPYFYSDLYPDYDATSPYDEQNAPPPQFILVRTPASSPSDDAPQASKPRPLLIEWHGDRYVRYGGIESQNGSENSAQADYSESASTLKPSPSADELPQPILVYRDGHREQIANYTIVDGIIYLRSDEWQNGKWIRRIPLATLDLPATIVANQQRGAKFLLPSAPNVVVASF